MAVFSADEIALSMEAALAAARDFFLNAIGSAPQENGVFDYIPHAILVHGTVRHDRRHLKWLTGESRALPGSLVLQVE